MNTGKKVAISLLISILIFACAVIASYTGVFSSIETHFYQPAILNSTENKLKEINSALKEYQQIHLEKFSSFLENESVHRSFLPSLPQEDIKKRVDLAGLLMEQTPGLTGIRFVDSDGKRIHYSTRSQDILNSSKNSIAYKNYASDEKDVSFNLIQRAPESKPLIYADSGNNQLIYAISFVDGYGAHRGTALFYISAKDVTDFLITRNLFSIGQTISPLAIPESNIQGLIIDMPTIGKEELYARIETTWEEKKYDLVSLLKTEDDGWFLLSDSTNDLILSIVLRESSFSFPDSMRTLLLTSILITIFLVFFLVFNFKQDPLPKIKDKIKNLESILIKEFLEKKREVSWKQISRELLLRRNDISKEIKASLGRLPKKHEELVDSYLNSSWEEILSAFGNTEEKDDKSLSNLTTEIKSMLEQVLANGTLKVQAINATDSTQNNNGRTYKPSLTQIKTQNSNTTDINDVEELESLEPSEAADDVEELESLEPSEATDDVEELESLEPSEAADDVEELESLEPSEAADDVEELESLEPSEAVDDVDEPESTETINQTEQEIKDEEILENLRHSHAEAIDEQIKVPTLILDSPDFSLLDLPSDNTVYNLEPVEDTFVFTDENQTHWNKKPWKCFETPAQTTEELKTTENTETFTAHLLEINEENQEIENSQENPIIFEDGIFKIPENVYTSETNNENDDFQKLVDSIIK